MKLRYNPASTGLAWVKLGVRTFFRQPLALAGLFFMFMATLSVLSIIPLLGTAIGVALVPAATLGLMAATREAEAGRFPMPSVLISAFRHGAERRRDMLMLGALYAGALLVVLALGALLAGAPPTAGEGGELTPEMVREAFDRPGVWLAMLLYVPVLMVFWHAPALVFWHRVAPVKSLFFSLLACWANKGALLFFTLGWVGVFMVAGLFLGLIASLLGGTEGISVALYPAVLLMAAMFHTSIWFTVRDSFDTEDTTAPAPSDNQAG